MKTETTLDKLTLLKLAAEYLCNHDMVISDDEAKEMLKPMLTVFQGICEGICGGAMDLCDCCSAGLYARDIRQALKELEKEK